MNRWPRLLLVAVAAGCNTAGPANMPSGATPRSALQTWADAFLAGSVEGMAACYQDSADVVMIHSTGETGRGIENVRAEYKTAFAEVVFEKTSLQLSGLWETGDVAWATGRFTATTRRKSDDSRWTLEINTSFVLRASDRSWKIALEQSTPVAGVPRVRPADP